MNNLKGKFNKQEKNYQQEYVSLTEDYKRITEQLKELRKKFRHFQVTDSKKYREIWEMNEEEVHESMRKVLQADKIIYEQQLGLPWTPPANMDALFRQGGAALAQREAVALEELGGPLPQKNIYDADVAHGEEGDNMRMHGAPMHGSRVASPSMEGRNVGTGVGNEGVNRWSSDYSGFSKTAKRMMELLCNEAGFLVEEKLNKLLNPLQRNEQSLMKLDAIFKALRIETLDDIKRLTSYFVKTTTSTEDAPNMNGIMPSPIPEEGADATPSDTANNESDMAAVPTDTATEPDSTTMSSQNNIAVSGSDAPQNDGPSASTSTDTSNAPNACTRPHSASSAKALGAILLESSSTHSMQSATSPDQNTQATTALDMSSSQANASGEPTLIHPNDVIKAIRMYLEDTRRERHADESTKSKSPASSATYDHAH